MTANETRISVPRRKISRDVLTFGRMFCSFLLGIEVFFLKFTNVRSTRDQFRNRADYRF